MLREKNIPYEEVIRLEDKLPELDVLYMTRDVYKRQGLCHSGLQQHQPLLFPQRADRG